MTGRAWKKNPEFRRTLVHLNPAYHHSGLLGFVNDVVHPTLGERRRAPAAVFPIRG